MPDVQGHCPACGAASLFLGEGGHVTCARIDCLNPCAADELLHGGEEALAQALGGDRTARIIAYNLHCHGHSLADVRRMTDKEFLGVPGIGHTSLRRIRRVLPEPKPAEPQPSPTRAGDVLAALGRRIPETLAQGISCDDYPLAPASEPPVVGAARIHLDVSATPDAVPVPQETFDRLVRVAMWVSRGQSMAHTPDPSPVVGARYPDTAARKALGALDDAGLLDTYRQAATEEAPDA
ncbi:hypothetical protein [Streptomyces parvus]|uniref:hypothetical protein n=1 Tax=Streptomyces parvus TaxID=66428 RepID=UPI0021011E7A|nr:hypothetical protein [Streptomyces parvus]MCQ1575363.1 hypothetical protein [Streptomyces parvus]